MNNFPDMTEERRQELIEDLQEAIKVETHSVYGYAARIALAALTADTSKLAELAAKVRKVREDAADFDGDRRGMWEHQEEQEQLLLEEAVKYTAPPAPVMRSVVAPYLPADCDRTEAHFKYQAAIRAAGYEVKS